MGLPALISLLSAAGVSVQAPGVSKFNIVVIEGQHAINALSPKSSRRLTVRVERKYGVPVASVPVTFIVPEKHGRFARGRTSITLKTDDKGYAVVRDFQPRGAPGRFHLQVEATGEGHTARAEIAQTNAPVEPGGFLRRGAKRLTNVFRRLKFW